MKIIKLGIMLMAIFTLFLLIGCSLPNSNYGKKADIRGSITTVNKAAQDNTGDIKGSILVEGNIEKDTTIDKALVNITKATRIFESKNGKFIEASFDSLKPDQRVQVLFTGPVMTSYPVQGTAKEVVILE